MKRYYTLITIASLLHMITYSQETVNWDQVIMHWHNYVSMPSRWNAIILERALSSFQPSTISDNSKRSYFVKQVEKDIFLLDRQIVSRDSLAIKIAFRLFAYTDASLSEHLDVALGQVIRIDPKLFLAQLYQNRARVPRMDALLLNLGSPYVDKADAQQLEKVLRIEAIESVHDSALVQIRSECLSAMKE